MFGEQIWLYASVADGNACSSSWGGIRVVVFERVPRGVLHMLDSGPYEYILVITVFSPRIRVHTRDVTPVNLPSPEHRSLILAKATREARGISCSETRGAISRDKDRETHGRGCITILDELPLNVALIDMNSSASVSAVEAYGTPDI
jgi:hypothetical protein